MNSAASITFRSALDRKVAGVGIRWLGWGWVALIHVSIGHEIRRSAAQLCSRPLREHFASLIAL